MVKKNITINDLAIMVQKGFEETSKKDEVNKRFDMVENRLYKIEKLIITDHKKRIEKLEMEVKELRELFAM
ncbi:MAG: hypothetical protein NTY81_03010 [Candidatus Staskawiczbacteria bacterium]|nr:hypothetical protein [Candidatus Staskawiczbacteria bacterium]